MVDIKEKTVLNGIGLMILATVLFSIMHASIKFMSTSMHPFVIAFFRNLFGLLVIAPWFIKYGLKPLKTNRIKLHMARSFFNVIAMLSFFYSLSIAPLADVASLAFTAPLFASILAVIFLKEIVGFKRGIAIIFGFIGALIVIDPVYSSINNGHILVLLSASVWSVSLIIIKILGRTESSVTITSYMVIIMIPLSAIAAYFYWQLPTLKDLFYLMIIGVCGTGAQMLLAQALRQGDTSIIMPFDFLKLIWDQGIKKILMAPINMLKNLGETMFDFIKGLVKSLPFGIGDKLISGMKGMTEGSQAGTAGDIAGEASMDNFSGGDTITSTAPSASGAVASKIEDPKEETVVTKPKAKPKTVNMDKTSGVTKVAEATTKGKSESYTEEQKKKDLEAIDQVMKGGYGKRYSGTLKDLQAQGAVIPKTRAQAMTTGIGTNEYEEYFDEKMKQNVAAGVDPEEVRAFMIMQERMQKLGMAKSDIKMGIPERPEIMENNTSIDSNSIPQVNKRDLKGDGAGSQGNVTVVNNQPSSINTSTNVAKTSVTSVPLNTSSGDSYFDKQANNINV